MDSAPKRAPGRKLHPESKGTPKTAMSTKSLPKIRSKRTSKVTWATMFSSLEGLNRASLLRAQVPMGKDHNPILATPVGWPSSPVSSRYMKPSSLPTSNFVSGPSDFTEPARTVKRPVISSLSLSPLTSSFARVLGLAATISVTVGSRQKVAMPPKRWWAAGLMGPKMEPSGEARRFTPPDSTVDSSGRLGWVRGIALPAVG
mmetsp:Transcript_26222/g.39868  ORF Transcript_26222/g.39868 Transcript_26222/m.39868 type:complete len:202 (-) Transcript_26222:7-612(-)